jgi:uncharacterized protein (TIGR02145 family)
MIFSFGCNKSSDPVTPWPGGGNTGATTVTIGTQVWTAVNLNVENNRNGNPIPQVQDSAQWANLTTGAWCYYNNYPAFGNTYGKLYNWYAVNDPRGLAPAGWHIPSDAEWTELTNYLGGESVAGGKLKDTTLWLSPNTGATNSSGFTAFPGGARYYNGFGGVGEYGYFWSASGISIYNAWYRSLSFNKSDVFRTSNDKGNGLSVRCVRD